MASGWNLWVWLECIGVVSGCCKEVYRFPHNNYYFSLLYLYYPFFWQQHPYFFVHLKKCFRCLFLCNIANIAQRTFEIVRKLRSCEHGDIIISTRMYVDCVRTRVPRLPRARYRVPFQESCI